MTKKEAIIKGLKNMNISMLEILLDDEKTYMDATKEVFLEKLNKKIFEPKKKDGILKFDQVIPGFCGQCNKGCGGYTFLANDGSYLDMLFEEKNNEIQDIYRCSDFINPKKVDKKYHLYFSFYEEEKADYNPSPGLLHKIKKIKEWENELGKFKNNVSNIDEFLTWFKKNNHLKKTFTISDNFNYKFLSNNSDIRVNFSCIEKIANEHKNALEALAELKTINPKDEAMLIRWLFKHENDELTINYGFEKVENWKKNGLIILTDEPSIVLDCKKYIESLYFEKTYNTHFSVIFEKYFPTDEHYKKRWENKGSTLYQYLKLHQAHKDILYQYEKDLKKLEDLKFREEEFDF